MAALQIMSCLEATPSPGGRTLIRQTNVMLVVFIGRMDVLFILLKTTPNPIVFQ